MATILIVDDHAINRQFLLTLLGYGGHRLIEAAEGAQALELARAERPDLVITDILMPNMDGYEFVTGMRADRLLANVPVIFYTASYRAREARSMAQACGVKWVLSKPSDPEDILAVVQEALGSRQETDGSASPKLSASIGADKFSTLSDQLVKYLGDLGSSGDALAPDSERTTLLAERDKLRDIATHVADSVTSLQEVSSRLTRLIELGLDLAAERDPARMLEILCRAAHGVCAVKHAAVAILDSEGIGLGFCFARGMGNEIIAQLRALPPRSGVLGRLIDERIPCRLNGLDGDPTPLGLPASHPPVHSFLGVPIASKEHTYGWLYLTEKLDDGDFSEVDEQIAATIAFQMAAAYENVILYDEVHQHRAQLQMEVVERKHAQEALRRSLRARTVMAQCNRVLVHATDEAALLSEMCETIVETGRYPMVWIGYVVGDENAPLTVMASAGIEIESDIGKGHRVEIDSPSSVAGIAIRSARSHVIGDTANHPDADQLRVPVATNDYRSALALPLKDGDQVFGTLVIYESEPNAFSRHQIEMLEELADDIAYGAVSLRDRRAREQAERSLLAAQEQLTGILNSIDNIVWSISKEEFLYVSPVAEKVFGYPVSNFYADKMLWMNAIHPEDKSLVMDSIATLHSDGAVTREYRIVRPDGEIRWLEDRTRAVRDQSGKLLRFDGVASDITHRKDYEERIEYLATHDPLTGLANRNLLRDRLAQGIAYSRRSAKMLALLFIDLDRFKDINDSFGHAVGDALLVGVAARLHAVVRECDTVARPGGDEFIIMLTEFTALDDVTSVVRKLGQAFSTPFVVGEIELHVTASIGISVFPTDGEDIETLLRNTDTAMYGAKARGGNSSQFYTADMSVQAMKRMDLESALYRALDRNQFTVVYQPKAELLHGQIIGVEALLRWNHPELGEIPPTIFIPIAEEIGLISSIGAWVLQNACSQNVAWQLAGLPPITVSVNISARQFRNDDLVNSIVNILNETGLPAQFLELELTEGLVMHSAELFIDKLNGLKAIGVQLSIDDFGTGYSSLAYLKRFPLDRLKIDQSFVREITTSAEDSSIARSIISLGHSLNLKVIAEGVETNEQVAFLRSQQCDEIQGNIVGEPMPGDQIAALLRSHVRLK